MNAQVTIQARTKSATVSLSGTGWQCSEQQCSRSGIAKRLTVLVDVDGQRRRWSRVAWVLSIRRRYAPVATSGNAQGV